MALPNEPIKQIHTAILPGDSPAGPPLLLKFGFRNNRCKAFVCAFNTIQVNQDILQIEEATTILPNPGRAVCYDFLYNGAGRDGGGL